MWRDSCVRRHRPGDAEHRSRRRGAEDHGRTQAIIPVHLFGRPAPLEALRVAGDLPIFEDSAQAFGAPGIATTGIVSTFSFFPTKNLFCSATAA